MTTTRRLPPLLVGLTGPNAAGKGEVANFLVSRGLIYQSLSDVIREEAALRGLPPTRENLIEVGNLLRREGGPAILAEKIIAKLSGRDVVDSIRNPHEVMALQRQPSFILIGVSAPIEIRFARARARSRPGDGGTLQEFAAREERERSLDPTSQQIHLVMEMADLTVDNSGTIEDLHRVVAAALEGRI